jgi:hypothetical protein
VSSRFSAGANALLAAGAAVVRDAGDVLDVVVGPGAGAAANAAAAAAVAPAEPLEAHLRRLLRAIERGRGTPAELAGDAAAFAAVLHDLTELELRGLVGATSAAATSGRCRPDEQSPSPSRTSRPRRRPRRLSRSLPFYPHRMRRAVPAVLSIAGSDSGGGAGIQADLKAFAACGVHGMTAITALTAQNTVGVTGVHPVPGTSSSNRSAPWSQDIGVDAVKIGMLGTAATVGGGRSALDLLVPGTPIVLDP